MRRFQLYTIESAPEKSRRDLQALQQTFGFIPNIAAVMAGSPALIHGFSEVFQSVHAGAFTEGEIQTLLLSPAFDEADVLLRDAGVERQIELAFCAGVRRRTAGPGVDLFPDQPGRQMGDAQARDGGLHQRVAVVALN